MVAEVALSSLRAEGSRAGGSAILSRNMTDESVDNSNAAVERPDDGGPRGSANQPPSPADPWSKPAVAGSPSARVEARPTRRSERRTRGRRGRSREPKPWTWRRVVRWIANLMIIGGIIGIPGYYLSTCAYTALQQRDLRKNLVAANPQLSQSDTALTAGNFVNMGTSGPTTTEISAEQAAELQHKAELAAFKAAADAFAANLGGKIGQPIGRIVIPSIGLDVVMVEGTSKGDLKVGPGHWEETPFPGQDGNFVVSGHRTTYGAPFFKLNDIKVGDEIDLILPYVVARYTVTETLIVLPTQVEAVRQAGHEQVSLAACHPIYSARQRIVVKGDLTSFKLIGQDTGSSTTTTTSGG